MKKGSKIDHSNGVKRRIRMKDNKGIEFIFWQMHVNIRGGHAVANIQRRFTEAYPTYKKGTITSSMSALKKLGFVHNRHPVSPRIKGYWWFTDVYLERFKPGGTGAITPEELHALFHERKS